MRLTILFFVVVLSLVMGETRADSNTMKSSSSEAGSSSKEGSSCDNASCLKEENSSEEGRSLIKRSSSKEGNSSEKGSSSKEGTSSKNGHSSKEETSSKEGNSSNEENSSKERSSSSEGSSANEINSSEEEHSSIEETSSSEERSSEELNRSEEIERLSAPEECARTCKLGEKPKTCYYHFTVEYYATLTTACQLCRSNSTTRLINDCQCITGDGYELSGIVVANRMYPGPSIMVCLNDKVVIDVENNIQGNGVTLHWHGLLQKGYQYYDGVPYLTQCPIQEGATFRYQWKAQNSGTHFWHSHTGLQKSDGLEGAIVIREPKIKEPNNQLWDEDNIDNVIFLSDWYHDGAPAHFPGNHIRKPRQLPDNYLINGMGQWTDPATGTTTETPLATFTIKQGRRYRFRMINSCSATCPVQLTIQGHELTIIASDGEAVEPVTVTSITSFSAERYDFIINANQTPGNYWIQLRGLAECVPLETQQLAILHYESTTLGEPKLARPSYKIGLEAGIVLNQFNVPCDGSESSKNVICVKNLKNVKPVPKRILAREPDIRIWVPFGFYEYEPNDIFAPGTYKTFMVPLGRRENVAVVGKNVTNVLPASPLITQRDEIPNEQFCTFNSLPKKCDGLKPCPCTLVEKIPLDSVVEIILVDSNQLAGLSHPFHLHGATFYVIGDGVGDAYNITNLDLINVQYLDEIGLLKRNLRRPPAKDTYAVHNNGFTIIRFLANNPGYWFFHCHFHFHLMVGMSAIFHVGEPSDLPPIPKGFPKCGNFIPPIN